MKELLVIRHAKSSWANVGQQDFDRSLNERGHHDAPEMAKRLVNKKIEIDAFISSPAVRALTTATYFAKAYNKTLEDIEQIKRLYHAPSNVFFDVIQTIDPAITTAALFAHNPGITDFVLSLHTISITNMPTCGVFGVKLHTNDWSEIHTCKKECWFFDYPKLD